MATASNSLLTCSRLPGRGLLAVTGADRCDFLQGLVSNDVERVAPDRALYAALLTPQGKFLHDFFVLSGRGDGALWLDCEVARLDGLRKRLAMYKLRADVVLTDISADWTVAAVFGEDAPAVFDLPAAPGRARPFAEGIAYVDPRLAELGVRVVLPAATAEAALAEIGLTPADAEAYDGHRLALGVPDGSRDMTVEKTLLLEAGFDALNGVDWNKGCYVGQELTARTKYRATIRKRLMPVAIDGPTPAPGTPVTAGDQEAGEMRSSRDGRGLALLRLDAIDSAAPLIADGARLTPHTPDWASA
ncbi:MAG: CAF17-like 4Fe-4S cluster assembly/insertion protein YgfZ [Alphaproteobacteria bacterium]